MDQSYFIAAHLVTRNVNTAHHAQAEDAFYNDFGKDRLAGARSAMSKVLRLFKVAKDYLHLPAAAAITRKA